MFSAGKPPEEGANQKMATTDVRPTTLRELRDSGWVSKTVKQVTSILLEARRKEETTSDSAAIPPRIR